MSPILRALVFVILLPGVSGALLGAAVAVPAEDGPREPWLAATGIPVFCEIESDAIPEWLASPFARVIQVAESRRTARALDGARVVAPDALVSARLRRDALEGPVLVVSQQSALAYRFAARLVRAGAPRVAVLRGAIDDEVARTLSASNELHHPASSRAGERTVAAITNGAS